MRIAQARCEGVRLASSDTKFAAYDIGPRRLTGDRVAHRTIGSTIIVAQYDGPAAGVVTSLPPV
jgi:hypothetical protein